MRILCGDGVVEGDEECDDGNTNDVDACTNDCKLSRTAASTSAATRSVGVASAETGITVQNALLMVGLPLLLFLLCLCLCMYLCYRRDQRVRVHKHVGVPVTEEGETRDTTGRVHLHVRPDDTRVTVTREEGEEARHKLVREDEDEEVPHGSPSLSAAPSPFPSVVPSPTNSRASAVHPR